MYPLCNKTLDRLADLNFFNLVSKRGNPLLTSIKNIGWEYGDIVPDYQVGVSACILYLRWVAPFHKNAELRKPLRSSLIPLWFFFQSLRYHRLHPEYIHNRIEKLQNMYTLRVILVMCDVVSVFQSDGGSDDTFLTKAPPHSNRKITRLLSRRSPRRQSWTLWRWLWPGRE